jgi:hypothetical protein
MLCFHEGENDEDMTCLDMTIQASSTLRMAFHQEGEDDENMTLLHTKIRQACSYVLFSVILRIEYYLKILGTYLVQTTTS